MSYCHVSKATDAQKGGNLSSWSEIRLLLCARRPQGVTGALLDTETRLCPREPAVSFDSRDQRQEGNETLRGKRLIWLTDKPPTLP